MSQIPLPMDWSERGNADRLLMTSANAQAMALLRQWQQWPSPCTLLVGPSKSGRSLIGRLFQLESGGTVVDDADQVDERHLFGLWNMARESGAPLLLIARDAPPIWAIELPDLRTRLATAAVARITAPEENDIAALIAHGLEHAGSAFAPGLPEYIARRVTRCYEVTARIIVMLNAESLASGRKLTVATARHLLEASGLATVQHLGDESGEEGAGMNG